MNWRKLNELIQYFLGFFACFLIFINCASATIGLLYLQNPRDLGFQYLPLLATFGYFLARLLFAISNGLSITKNELLGYAFIISTTVSIGMQIWLNVDAIDRDGKSALNYTTAMWAFNVFYFFAGAACIRASYKKSNIVAVILTLLVLVPFLFAPKQAIFLDYFQLRQITGIDGLSHLVISEWCVFLLIGAFAFAGDRLRPLIIIVAAVCLFGLQGRSSTFFTVFTFLAFWMLISGTQRILTYVGIMGVVTAVFMIFPITEVLLGSNQEALDRMMLSSDDGSLNAREDIFLQSLQHLPHSIPYGDPTYIALEAGSMGSYIHNILSMWQFFGLLPFIFIIIILIRSLLVMKARIKRGQLTVMQEIACMLLIYVTVSVVFAKSVVFYWLWFAAGYWILQYYGSKRQDTHDNGHHGGQRRRSKKRRSRRRRSQPVPG